MTTAASHPIIHTTKKPYYYPPNLFFPNWVCPHTSRFTLNSNNAFEAITTQTRRRRHKYGWWRIATCAPPAHRATNYSLLPPPPAPPPLLRHHRHQNLGPRFRGPHKCLSISSSSSSSSPNSGRSENEGELSGSAEPGAGLMADMGSEDQSHSNNHEWFDSQFHPDKDELLSPMQNHHQPPPHQSPKLLTLPTILTLGRVAAVPLLISSMFNSPGPLSRFSFALIDFKVFFFVSIGDRIDYYFVSTYYYLLGSNGIGVVILWQLVMFKYLGFVCIQSRCRFWFGCINTLCISLG